MFSPLEQFEALIVISLFVKNFDISFLQIMIPALFVILLLAGYYWVFKAGFSEIFPSIWLQSIVEILYKFIWNLLNEQLGKKGYKFFPFIFSLFIFLLVCNLFSLTPFVSALTSHIISIFFLTFSLLGSIFLIGLKENNIKFLRIFIPECPFFLLLLLIPIEIFSYCIRAFSLAIRLSANIMAGHTLVYLLSTLILQLLKINVWFVIAFSLVVFAICLLEFGVAFLQAYVFTILVMIYLADALNMPSH